MIVVDASAVVDFLLRRDAHGEWVDTQLSPEPGWHCPELVDPEVLHALRRRVANGDVSAVRAGEAIEDLLDMPAQRYPHAPLVRRAWELRQSVSMYDALYIALAEVLDATLVTTDLRLARAVTTVDVAVPS